MRDLNRKMARGILWMGALKVSVRGIGLVSIVILARLLVPADFGLIAMATSVLAFLELATAFSFDIPLIQNQKAERRHYDTAWTLNLIFHVALTVLLVALAGPAASFYQEERLVPVIYALSAGFFATGFSNIGVVQFRKELDFRMDYWVMLSQKLIGFVITIPLALWLRSYWALVIGMVAGNVLGVAATYFLHPYRPRFSLSCAGEMFNFSKWLILNNAVQFLRTRSPDFIIGRVSGTSALGLFSISYEISALPISEIVAPINRVVFSGYSKLSSNIPLLRQSYTDTLAVIAICALPFGFGISAVAVPLIELFFGQKWAGAAPLVGILGIFGGLHALHSNSGSIYNAIGKPYLITLTGACNITVLVLASIVLILEYGVIGIAVAYLGTSVLLTPFNFFILCREIGLELAVLLSVLWRPLIASIFMYACVAYTDTLVTASITSNSAVRLVMLFAEGVLAYLSALWALWFISGRDKATAEYRLTLLLWRKASTLGAIRADKRPSQPS